MTTLDIGSIVRVSATIAPSGTPREEFGRTLLLTPDAGISPFGSQRVRHFAALDEVGEVFPHDSEPYRAARVYFGQSPYPKDLLIGRWAESGEGSRLTGASPVPLVRLTGKATTVTGAGTVASLDMFHGRATVVSGTGTVASLETFHGRATVLTGTGTVASLETFHGRATVVTGTGTVADLVNFHGRATVLTGGNHSTLATLQGITAGTVTFLSQTVTGLDFSSDTDLDGVASTLQTALRATSSTDLDNAEVIYDGTVFVVTLPLDSSTGVVPTASAAFTGDDADELGLDTATIVNGVDAIMSGTVTFLSQTLTGLDFSAVADFDDVASVLQTALRATSATSLDEVEVVYDESVFVVTLPLDSSGVVPTASAAFTGDDADELGLDTATIANGVDAIMSGTVTFLSQTLTGLDFSAVTDYDDVASVLQTALRATSATSLDEVEVVYDESVFVVTLPLDSSGVVPTASAAFTGDDADELGLDTATIANGVDAIMSGTVTFLSQTLTGLDFSAVTDYDDVASVLQNALRAASMTALASVEVAFQGGVFVVTIPLDSQGAATSVSGAFTGDSADELGMDTATIVDGVDAITAGTVTFLEQTASDLDFSNVTDYDGVASVLQAGLRGTSVASLAEVEVAYTDGQFVITIPLDSDGLATSVSGPFTGSSANELGLDTVSIDAGVDGVGNGSISWRGRTIAALDFTGAVSYSDIASTLQTAVRTAGGAGLDTALVFYDVPLGALVVRLGFAVLDGSPYQIEGPMEDVSQTSAKLLGLDLGTIAAGYADEGIEEALTAIQALDDAWYFLAVDSRINGDAHLMDLAAWVQFQPHMLALDVLGPDVLASEESASLAARLSALEQERTFLVWSETPDYKALSVASRLSSVSFDGANTLITAKFKSLPGTEPDALNRSGQAELNRKRVNYYTRFGPDAIFAEGWTLKPGTWIDVRYWLDWIVDEIRHRVFGLLRTQPTRLPQTQTGTASLKAEVERVCEMGVRNGGLAPGPVSEAVANNIRLNTGNRDFSGQLTRGFLVHIDPVSSLTGAQRAARLSPPVKVWLKGSGAVHFADIELVFVN